MTFQISNILLLDKKQLVNSKLLSNVLLLAPRSAERKTCPYRCFAVFKTAKN
jgi:hypothetical protein